MLYVLCTFKRLLRSHSNAPSGFPTPSLTRARTLMGVLRFSFLRSTKASVRECRSQGPFACNVEGHLRLLSAWSDTSILAVRNSMVMCVNTEYKGDGQKLDA